MDLLASGCKAAVKLTGDPSRVGDSTDEDLETGERDLDSLDSLQLLARLTGVLTRLTGVLVDLCGVLGLLSGVLAGMADLLGVESCLGTGTDDYPRHGYGICPLCPGVRIRRYELDKSSVGECRKQVDPWLAPLGKHGS